MKLYNILEIENPSITLRFSVYACVFFVMVTLIFAIFAFQLLGHVLVLALFGCFARVVYAVLRGR